MKQPKYEVGDYVKLTGKILKTSTNDVTGQDWIYSVAIVGATVLNMQLHNMPIEIHEKAIEKIN